MGRIPSNNSGRRSTLARLPDARSATIEPTPTVNSRWKIAAVILLGVAWTVALLVPIPHQTASEILGSDDAKFWFAKTLHMSMYAIITFLAGTFRLDRRERVAVLATIFAHAGLTEFFQQFVGRGASVRDVAVNSTGIVLGVLAGWKWWRGIRKSPAST